jgi:pectinesterase
LIADTSVTKVYLGRPWRLNAYTAFVQCEMGPQIISEGWHNWNKPEAEQTARYIECGNFGPGANAIGRVAWSHQLSEENAGAFALKNVFGGFDNWDPGLSNADQTGK